MPFDPNSAKKAGKKSKRGPAKKEGPSIKEKMEMLYEKVLDDLLINQDKLTKTERVKVFVTLSNYIFPKTKSVRDKFTLEQLKEKVSNLSLHDKVKFIGKKTPEELKELTPNATIGMSLEEDLGLNYRYALPNKIFDYLHANVPVIVSDLPEMRGLIKRYSIGEILTERTPKTLAKTIISMTNNSYEKELKTAKKELNWSKEKEKLISIFSKLDK